MANRIAKSPGGVGYKNPPTHTRFTKGVSGNPKGRPKGARNLRLEFLEELNEAVPVTLGGKSQLLSKQRIAIKALVAHAMKGNISAASKVFDFWHKTVGFDELTENEEIMAPADREILAAFIEQNGRKL